MKTYKYLIDLRSTINVFIEDFQGSLNDINAHISLWYSFFGGDSSVFAIVVYSLTSFQVADSFLIHRAHKYLRPHSISFSSLKDFTLWEIWCCNFHWSFLVCPRVLRHVDWRGFPLDTNFNVGLLHVWVIWLIWNFLSNLCPIL